MIDLRKSSDRGYAHHGWLETYHSFSFADYHDPAHMGFRSLRVINEDVVAPGQGFPMHPHRDMEIITWILSGALEHTDSLGNGSVIRPGEIQLMRAGSGVTHSEFNPSKTEPVHLLQIWIRPDTRGLTPAYDQKDFPRDLRRNTLCPLVTPDGRSASLRIHQDARLFATTMDAGRTLTHDLAGGRHAWLQVTSGAVEVNGMALATGDGAAVSAESRLVLEAGLASDILLFDMS